MLGALPRSRRSCIRRQQAELKPNSVGTKQLKDGAVTNGKLGDGAVTVGKLAGASVTKAKFAASGVATVTNGATIGSTFCNQIFLSAPGVDLEIWF